MPLSTKPSASSMLCVAIHRRSLLEFDYDDKWRIVEPYCHGTSTAGVEILRAVQVGGESSSSGFGFGKLWTVAKMSNLHLGDPFSPSDPNYNPNDSAMRVIHCRI